MATEWLNHQAHLEGQWQHGQPEFVKSSNTVTLGGVSVRIHETAISGAVLLSPAGSHVSSYGGAEVYLKIAFSNRRSTILSAPLGTPVELEHVESLELNLLCLVGNAAATSVSYRAAVNGHCVYERLSLPAAVDSNLVSGARGAAKPGQSYNETRAVDVTVLTPASLAVDRLTLDGYRLLGGSALVGARIYASSSQALVSTSQDVSITGPSVDVPIVIPVTATLVAGGSYRIGFYVIGNPPALSSADVFEPASFPYSDQSGRFRINSAHAVAGDAFPQGPNTFAPRVTVRNRVI